MILRKLRSWAAGLPRLRRLAEHRWFYPAALLLVGLLAYAYQLTRLGFYWDDWEVVFLLNARSASLLYGYFAFDRPFAWPYQAMYALFGLRPAAWHLATLLLRWGAVVLLYLSLRTLWPRLDSHWKWAGALLLVYPGFFQQSISTAYQRHFTSFFLFALSIYLMVLAARRPRQAWLFFPLSWALAFLQVFTIEYFVGLELIRPMLLWALYSGDGRARPAVRTALAWLPYLLVFGIYAWWRAVIFPAGLAKLNYTGDFKMLEDFRISFAGGVLALVTRLFNDLIYSTLQVWSAGLTAQDSFTLQSKAAWFALGLGVLVAALFAFFQRPAPEQEDEQAPGPGPVFMLGAWAFLVSSLPIWLTSKQLSGGGRWDDRFALAPMLGAVLMSIALLMWLVRPRWQKLVLAAMLAMAVATQALVANRYRLDWQEQRDYYWQLAWRAPALQPGTAVISFEQPSLSVPGYDASFALNVLYGGHIEQGVVPYWFFTNDRFLNFELVPGKRIRFRDRNLSFDGNTSQAIAVVHQGQDRCLQVLDADYAGQPFQQSAQAQLVPLSNVGRILPAPSGNPPDAQVFGREPSHDWCYYFEKADLARQMQDWGAVLKLEKEAEGAWLAPKFGPEFLPFIEANARKGDWQRAYDLSLGAQTATRGMEPLLCSTWQRLAALPSAEAVIAGKALHTFACTTP